MSMYTEGILNTITLPFDLRVNLDIDPTYTYSISIFSLIESQLILNPKIKFKFSIGIFKNSYFEWKKSQDETVILHFKELIESLLRKDCLDEIEFTKDYDIEDDRNFEVFNEIISNREGKYFHIYIHTLFSFN